MYVVDENIQLKKIFKAKFNMKYKKYLCPFHVKYIFFYLKFRKYTSRSQLICIYVSIKYRNEKKERKGWIK